MIFRVYRGIGRTFGALVTAVFFRRLPLAANGVLGQTARMSQPADRIQVRRASVSDIPPLCGLLALLFGQEADFTPDPDRQRRGLRLILEQPGVGLIFCAESPEGVIGMVSILFTVSTAEGGRVACLEDMFVDPGQRGHGIGERLLHEAIRSARDAGCKRITLLTDETDETNSAAMRFYSRAGFVRSRMVPFRLKL